MDPVIERGEVWWAQVPDDKVRPVVVLTRPQFTPLLSRLIVVSVTSRVRGIPTEVALSTDDGMPRTCVANFDNIATVPRPCFKQRITRLSDERMSEICRAYRFAAGC